MGNDERPRPYYDKEAAALHSLGKAIVGGIKLVVKESGEVIEFGTALIINNDGTKTKTKKKQ